MNATDCSTPTQKMLVCFTSFACSCLGFVLGVVVLLPATVGVLSVVGAPNFAVLFATTLITFGTPIVTALVGLHLGVRLVIESGLIPNEQ